MQAISFSLALLSAFMLCTVARAQKQGVIISMETGAPLADVHIYTNNNIQTTTNYKGEWKIPYPSRVSPSHMDITFLSRSTPVK